jgi:hypothetical protein
MRLGYFEWHHAHGDIKVDGFSVRFDRVYPDIST